MKKIKAVLLTSNHLRHIWVANTIYRSPEIDLVGVVLEPKSKFYKKNSNRK